MFSDFFISSLSVRPPISSSWYLMDDCWYIALHCQLYKCVRNDNLYISILMRFPGLLNPLWTMPPKIIRHHFVNLLYTKRGKGFFDLILLQKHCEFVHRNFFITGSFKLSCTNFKLLIPMRTSSNSSRGMLIRFFFAILNFPNVNSMFGFPSISVRR